MNNDKNKAIHGLLTDLNLMDMKEDVILSVTDGNKSDSRDLTNLEANMVLRKLQEIREDRVKKMRGKIIHLLCLYGMTEAGQPDYKRINKFIQNIGVRNPKRKVLYNLSPGEMRNVLTQVEIMVNKTLKEAVR